MSTNSLRLVVFGAHPDDADFQAGGVIAMYVESGNEVKMVSVTNGEKGYHHRTAADGLADRRRAEAKAAGACLGAEYVVLDNPDGELFPCLDVRNQLVGIIREFRADLVITHRPYDYHPDHRYTSMAVQDAITMCIIPNALPDVPHLQAMPALFYSWDRFRKPVPFDPDIVVGTDAVREKKLDAIHCHTSQVYEAMPASRQQDVPKEPGKRRQWLSQEYDSRFRRPADLYREKLVEFYGQDGAKEIEYAEAFEVSEYGKAVGSSELTELFPFFSKADQGGGSAT